MRDPSLSLVSLFLRRRSLSLSVVQLVAAMDLGDQAGFSKTLQLSTISTKNRAVSLPFEFSRAICSPCISALAAITALRPSSRGLNRTRNVLSVILMA